MTIRHATFATLFAVATLLVSAEAASAQVYIQPFPGVPGAIHVQPIQNRGRFYDRASGLSGEVLRRGGIRVLGVDAFSPADRAGLSAGMTIASINGRTPYSQSDYVRALAYAGGDARMVVLDPYGRRAYVHAYMPVDPRFVGGNTTLVGGTTVVTSSNSRVVYGVPVAEMADVNGWWHSDAGDLRIWQTGTSIVGRLELADGRRADVTGKLVGDQVRFDWFMSQDHQGDGELQISSSGGTLYGKFVSQTGGSRTLLFKKS